MPGSIGPVIDFSNGPSLGPFQNQSYRDTNRRQWFQRQSTRADQSGAMMENVMANERTVVEMIAIKTPEGRTIGTTFKVAGVGETRVMFTNLHPDVREAAVEYGVNVRVSRMAAIAANTKTGKSATPAEKFARVSRCAEHLNSGAPTWELARGATGPRGPDAHTQLVIEAVALIQGVELATMVDRVKALCEKRAETPVAWAKRISAATGSSGDAIRAKILELQQRDSPESDVDDDLEELMNMGD
jgi:hypothetical protein